MDLTPEEILKVKTKGTLNIIPDSPLHNAIISAMVYYANQEVKKLTIPLVGVAKRKVCSIEETPNSCSYYNRYRGCINCPKFVEQT